MCLACQNRQPRPFISCCRLYTRKCHTPVMDRAIYGLGGSTCSFRTRVAAPRSPIQAGCRISATPSTSQCDAPRRCSSSISPIFAAGVQSLRRGAQARRPGRQAVTEVRAADADAASGAATGNRGPPSLLVRVASAFMYIVPWIDILGLGREVYHFFHNALLLYLLPGPLAPLYYSGQFVPLIVFFLLFLSIVKNNKLHHFLRFHCMQGVMLDIVSMLFTLLRAYVPAEFRWSYLMDIYDMFAWNVTMATILYCVFFALAGKYADVPYISESVYLQVDASL